MQTVSLFLACVLPFAFLAADESAVLKRIHAHVLIHDDHSAYQEAKEAVMIFPHSDLVHEAYIRSVARLGLEKEMLQAWKGYQIQFPDKKLHRELVEEMAWGVLKKASVSSSLIMQQMALLAALFSQEMHGVDILHQGMQNSNYAIRAFAVKLAGHLRDSKLIAEMKRLLSNEKVWMVRKEVIEAIGTMKIVELRSQLEEIIGSGASLAEEKAVAMSSLLTILEGIERSEVVKLSQSDRAGLRHLACQAIAHFRLERDLDLLIALAHDSQADVRAAAFQALGLLRPKDFSKIYKVVKQGVDDPQDKVVLSAAWLLTLYSNEGLPIFQKYLEGDKEETRLYASAALAATGKYGVKCSLRYFQTHADPFVRLNLAIGLAGQQIALEDVSKVLEETLETENERWSEKEWGIFEAISGRAFLQESDSFSSPEMENQLIRLKVLNILAILKSPQAQESIRKFLSERNWGVSASAASLLLTEGDDEALDLVTKLLDDPQPKVRLQAALVLSLWSRDEGAIKVLEQGYLKSENEQKARILEGIGRIGSMSSLPFLINTLQEPSQTLRLIAAMAMIQCLNH